MPTLTIDIAARLASFQDSLDKIGRQSEQMAGRLNRAFGAVKTGIAAIGVSLSAGAFASFVKSGIDAADALDDMSQRTGVAVESLSALNYAAQFGDVTMEQLSAGLYRLARAASDAAGGSKESAEAFTAIGVSVRDAQGNLRGTEDLLLDLAEQFAGMEDSAGKTAIAMRLFGRSGAELIPFLNLGRGGIEKFRKEAERLGIIISGDTARSAAEFNDNVARLAASADRAKIALADKLLPALTEIAQRMADAAKEGGLLNGILEGMRESVTQLFEASRKGTLLNDLYEVEQRIGRTIGMIQSGKMDVPLFGDVSLNDAGLASLRKNLDLDIAKAQELRELLNLLNGKAFGRPGNPGGTNPPDLGALADAVAAGRARIENEIKRVNGALKDQEADTAGSLQIMSTMLSQNLVSFETYYDKRRELAEQSLQSTVDAAQAEISALRRLRDILPKGSEKIGVDARIEEAQGKIEEAQRRFAQTSVQAYFESRRAAEDYARSLTDIEIQIKEISGDTIGAALGRFGQQTRELQLQAQARGDVGTLEQVNALRQKVVAQSQINDLLQQAQVINDQLANAEARVNVDRQSGAAGELSALQRLGEARQAALPQLREIADRYREIATSLGNPVVIQQAENFKLQIDELAASADAVGNRFREIGQSAFADFFTDVIDGTKSVKDAFADMARSILRSVNQLVAQDIAKKIFGSFGGSKGGGGITDFFGSLIGSIFGGARAEGGPVSPGKGYIVGENGPEWFVPRSAGTIVPNGAGAATINYSPTFIIRGDMTPQSRTQLAAAAWRGLQEGRRNL